MQLKTESDGYLLTLAAEDRRPLTEACREVIGLIATNDHINGERVYTGDDAHVVALLARVAIHANTKKAEPIPLDTNELKDLVTAIGIFAPIEAAKRAVEAEISRSGVLHNPRIEARVDLGQRAAGLLQELKSQLSLGDDAAPQAVSA